MTEKDEKRIYTSDEDNQYASENEDLIQEEMSFEDSSESEPEIECNTWDDSKILTNLNMPKKVTGCHLISTCSNNPEVRPTKRIKLSTSLNPKILEPVSLGHLETCWINNTTVSNDTVEIINFPYKLCIIKNFLENTALLEELRKEVYEISFNVRMMDLYEFFQSKDLKYLTSYENIFNIYGFLKNDVMKWVSQVTGFHLTHISATCSLYSNSDYLLVHDDHQEDRMVAFILYLTDEEGWDDSNGGNLQLFTKDANGQPAEIVRDIVPENNQFIFFPVTNYSYHQVAEVTTLSKYRLSINGWFHTKDPPVFNTPVYNPLEDGLYSKKCIRSKVVDINLDSWINNDYLDKSSVHLIQKHIEEHSEISLRDFLKQESFSEIAYNLQDKEIKWKKVGPINRFNYEVADLTRLPHVIERFLDLFQSTSMFRLLQAYTDLDLHTETASMKFELQKWTPGSYALLTEYNWTKNELDLIVYFGCKNSLDVIGARTCYVTIEDEIQNALITIEPEENNLNIVYRDSARFTKYFSKQSKCQYFYTLMCSYSE